MTNHNHNHINIKLRAFDGTLFWYSNTKFEFLNPLTSNIVSLQNAPFDFEDLELFSGLYDNSTPKKEIFVNDVVSFLNFEETMNQGQKVYATGFVEFLNGQFLINSKELGHQSLYGATNVTIIGYHNPHYIIWVFKMY